MKTGISAGSVIIWSAVGVLAGVVAVCPPAPGRPAADGAGGGALVAVVPPETAIAAVIAANDGKVPATGDQLWKVLGRVGKFAQLAVPFSAARPGSGIGNPRVVIAPRLSEIDQAEATRPNVVGRLFLAANMEKPAAAGGGEARVTSVEFISWNSLRRQFDFGVVENMGGPGDPQLHIVDGGKCFSCHKNRGPILGVGPWSNTAHDDVLRFAMASSLRLTGTALPQAGPFVLPAGAALRERVDGMAVAIPEAAEIDAAVRFGAGLRSSRDASRLVAHSPAGRKALVTMLVALTEPGPFDATSRKISHEIDSSFSPSLQQFASACVEMQKSAKPSTLADVSPVILLTASGLRPAGYYPPGIVSIPGLIGGNNTRWSVVSPGNSLANKLTTNAADRQAASVQKAFDDFGTSLVELARYDAARAAGYHGPISLVQPSNPRAFVKPRVVPPARLSDVMSPVLLAATIGLTDEDRRFLGRALDAAAKQVGTAKVTPATLAKEVFEGAEFAAFLGGGPLPDRDEFKDRFAAGLNDVLTTRHGMTSGFAPDRRTFTSGPRYDPAAVEEREVAVVPTTACLRCHEVGGPAKGVRFDLIPPLAFDPFDRPGRAAWLKTADLKQKRAVLSRMAARLTTDADMPPTDAPEYDRFRVKDAAAFGEVKRFLQAELEKVKAK